MHGRQSQAPLGQLPGHYLLKVKAGAVIFHPEGGLALAGLDAHLDVGGVGVGGASLDLANFLKIVNAVGNA